MRGKLGVCGVRQALIASTSLAYIDPGSVRLLTIVVAHLLAVPPTGRADDAARLAIAPNNAGLSLSTPYECKELRARIFLTYAKRMHATSPLVGFDLRRLDGTLCPISRQS